jgi:hypothetical protein
MKHVVELKSKVDAENAQRLETELDKVATRHLTLSRVRVVVFVLLYASIISTVGSALPILRDVVQTIAYITGVVGVSVLSILAFYMTYRIRQLYDHMVILYSHLVAIYEKHNKKVYSSSDLPAHIDKP